MFSLLRSQVVADWSTCVMESPWPDAPPTLPELGADSPPDDETGRCSSPAGWNGSWSGSSGSRPRLVHSETSDGVMSGSCTPPPPPPHPAGNQSARAWMWSRGGVATSPGAKRALSEHTEARNHLWHPPHRHHLPKRTSAPSQVCFIHSPHLFIQYPFKSFVFYMQMGSSQSASSAFPRMLLVLKSRRSWPVLSRTKR